MQIELNETEAQVLVNLLNVAVKSVGLEAAESSLHFANLIKRAHEASKAPPAVAAEAVPDSELAE